ncbi:uncharacterized threonine-rich GPI-anchored glycoprotein PJ4664.02-like isoform X2 [Lytechinus variegatus]|uniref:uncharacterized threonine-rich GPI-anchored glycoprotein PJ4664.02-like isoform X2 n=1 Tax=Lytechinus variegatus TaxID=7654 RepID=UPI001BB16621|nr:uncharacterized threonine-rich GPI-anchored glycoprotein PJ4664.02-like isoform X2 [Lytechinus variegatus]
MPTKLPTNQHAPSMGMLHPSSTLLAVLSAYHFKASYLSCDWPDSARFASLQPMTAVLSKVSNLHALLGFGTVSKTFVHETVEQLFALQTALSSSFQCDSHLTTLRHESYLITSRMPSTPMNCPITSRLLSSSINCPIKAAKANLHSSSQPIRTPVNFQTCLTPYSNITNLKPISSFFIHTNTRQQKIAQETQFSPRGPSLSCSRGFEYEFTNVSLGDNLTFSVFDPLTILSSGACCTSLSGSVNICFAQTANGMTIHTACSSTKWCIFCILYSSKCHSVFNLTNISLVTVPFCLLYSNRPRINEPFASVYSKTSLFIDPLHQNLSFVEENGCVIGNSILSLQTLPAGEVMMVTPGPLLTIIAASMTKPDHSRSISVAILTPALLRTASESRGSGSSWLSSATTLQSYHSFDLSPPRSFGWPTATQSSQKLPQVPPSSPSRFPCLQMYVCPVPLELTSHLNTNLLSNFSSGQSVTSFPVSMSPFGMTLSFGITVGKSSSLLPDLSLVFKLMKILEGALKILSFPYQMGLEAMFLRTSVPIFWFIFEQGLLFPFDWVIKNLSPDLTNVLLSVFISKTHNFSKVNASPDTVLHHIHTRSGIITPNLSVDNSTTSMQISAVHAGIAKSTTSCTLTVPSFEKSVVGLLMPSHTSWSRLPGLLFQPPDPIQTFHLSISPPSALSLFSQSPWHYLPASVSMATQAIYAWEIIYSVLSVFNTSGPLIEANQFYDRVVMDLRVLLSHKVNICGYFTKPFTSNLLLYFFSIFFLMRLHSPGSSFSKLSFLFPSLSLLLLSFLSIPFLSFLPVTSGLSSSYFNISTPNSPTASLKAMNSTLVPTSPSMSFPSPSTSSISPTHHTDSFHAPIPTASPGVNDSHESHGLPEITSVIATPSRSYPDGNSGNSSSLSASAYASISPVSAQHMNHSAEASLHPSMRDPSLLSLPISRLSLDSPGSAVHETVSLHLTSASPVPSSRRDTMNNLLQLSDISMSTPQALLSIITPTASSHTSSATLRAYFTSVISVSDPLSSGLVTPSLPSSFANAFPTSFMNVESQLSFILHASSKLNSPLHPLNADYTSSFVTMIQHTPLSSLLMQSFLSDAHMSSTSHFQISHSFQHISKESATTPWLMHPSFTTPFGLSFAASSKETLHSSLPSSHATVSSSYSALRSSHSALQSYSYSSLLYLPFTYSSLSSHSRLLSLHSPFSSLNSPSSSLNSPLPSSHPLLPSSHPHIPSSPSTLPSSHSHFTLLSPLPSSRLSLPSLHSHLQSSHLHLPSSPSTLLPSHSPLTSLHSLLSSSHSPLPPSHSHLQSSHSLFPSLHSPLSSQQHLPSSLSSLPRDLSLVSFMPPKISSSPHNSHPPHPSQTSILDRITPVTTSPLSFLPNIGSVTTSSPSLVSASLPSRLPSNETESVITMATRMLTSTSTSLINPPSLDTSLESTAVMNSINTSEALSSMTSSPLSTFSKLDVVSPSSANFSDASTVLETVLFTQTSFDFVTPSDTASDSVEVDLTTDHSSFIRMIDSTAMNYPTLTPSFVTPSFDGSSLVPQEPSFSTLTPTKYLTSVYDSYTLISTPYSVDSLTIVSTLTQYYDSVTPVPSNIYTMESIGSNFSHPGRLTPVPSTPTQTPYTTTSEHETMLPTQTYTYSTPVSQVLIQTPTLSLSSWMNISSSLQPSSVSLIHSMPDTLLTPSVSDTTSLQTNFPSSFLDSTPLLISLMTDYVIMSSGVTITSMPIDVSIETSSSVIMPDVLHSDSVDTLSSTDGILTSTSLPLSTATTSLVPLQTSTPESSMLSPMTSKELSNTSTEGSQTLHSFSTSERMSAIVQTPILSSSVQSMSSVQANESMPSLSLFTNLSTLQEDLSSTYAIMPSDVISQTMMQTIITSFVNSSQSEIMPSPSIYIPMQSSVFNSTMQSSLMDSLLSSVATQTGMLPMQASTAVVGSDHVSSTLDSNSNMSSVSMLPMPSAGQMTMVTSVAMESSTPLVNKSDSLFPTSSSGFDSVSSSIVAMATEMPLSSSSGMILPTPNSTISSDFPGFNSTLPTPSLPFMPLSSSSLPPNSTLHSGAPATPIFSSLSPVTSILSTPSMSLVSSSILETRSNSSSPTTTVSVEILSTPLVSLSTPSASVSVSSVFVPTSPTSQTNLSTTDTTPVVVSTTNQSLSAEPTTVVMNTSSVTPPTSSPNADNVTVSPQTTGAVVSPETSSMTPGVSTFLNYTMTTTPATNVTTSSPGTTSTPTTPVTTPMDTTEATTPEATVPPTTSTTIPPTTHVETTTPTVVTTNQDVTNSSTEPRTTQTRTPTPFDTSFATKPYWLTMGLAIDENINVNAPSYVEEMEGNLADMYVEANRRSNQRMVEVEQLLDQLDPERNPAVDPGGARRRRAVTVDTITAQIIDMTRLTNPTKNVDLTFYIVEEGTKLLSGEAKAVLDELTLQEMTLYMAVPVNSPPIEVVPSTTVMPSAEPPARLWIIAAVLVPLALLFFCCLCCCCCCCGRKPRKEDGPMDPDTFKMLQFKAKYPYRQYPGSPQDQHLQPVPRGFDVVKQDYANNAFGMEAGTVEGKQQIEEEAEMMIQRELPRRTVEGHVSPVLHSRNQYPIGQSPTPSGTSSSSLVPPLPVKTKGHQRVRDGSTSGSDTGEELYKQRREYMAAQEEISRVLEPELYSSQGRKRYSRGAVLKGSLGDCRP